MFLRHGTPLLASTPIAATYAHIAPQGATGVSFFFILSGFVLAWTYRPGESARRFYRRRVARVVPAYLAAIGLGLVYSAVSWSLSTEVFFYALFPLLIAPIMRLDRRGLICLAAGAAVVSVAVPLLLAPEKGGGVAFWAIYINPLYRLMEFVIGLCLCGLLVKGVRLRIPLTAAVALAVGGYLLARGAPLYAMWVTVTLIPYAVLIFAFAESDLRGRVTILHHPVLIRLGIWSFAFYLLHTFVIQLAIKVADKSGSTAWHIALWIGSYGGAIVAAYLLYRVVEHPMERRIRAGGPPTAPAP